MYRKVEDMANLRNPIYTDDPLEWEALTLAEQIEHIVRDCCEGPSGHSMKTLTRRVRIYNALNTVLKMLHGLPYESPVSDRGVEMLKGIFYFADKANQQETKGNDGAGK
jgi:hypothetical protein